MAYKTSEIDMFMMSWLHYKITINLTQRKKKQKKELSQVSQLQSWINKLKKNSHWCWNMINIFVQNVNKYTNKQINELTIKVFHLQSETEIREEEVIHYSF